MMSKLQEKSTSAMRTNGSGAAALLAAGIGSFAVAAIAFAADKSPAVKAAFIFYKPTGPLSGITTTGILVWLIVWAVLHVKWQKRTVALGAISTTAVALLILSVLLTFPPLADLL